MKSTSVAAIFLAAGLAGCATPGDVRKKLPALELSSSNGAKAVSGCIADKWEALGHRSLSSRPTTNGYALASESDLGIYGKDTAFVVDVSDTKTGSATIFYSNITLASGLEYVSKIIKDCQK